MSEAVETVRQQLAQLDAEVRHEEEVLHRMQTDGVDHFNALHQEALPHLDQDSLDAFSEQAGALAAISQEGA